MTQVPFYNSQVNLIFIKIKIATKTQNCIKIKLNNFKNNLNKVKNIAKTNKN